MELHIISTGSIGNAYILESSTGEVLLIECGVVFNKIKQALNFNLKRVSGCLVTHEHGDHAKGINDVLYAGINVYASAGTHKECGTHDHHRSYVVANGSTFDVGSFKVKAFDVKHDVKEPLGFLIYHKECGTVLFLTDTKYCETKFWGLNNIIIEANYCQTILDRRLMEGADPKFLRDRVITSHMSLDTCKKTLKSYDLSKVNNIVLIHLSDRNSHAARFQREVQETTGKTTHIGDIGIILPFNKTPF